MSIAFKIKEHIEPELNVGNGVEIFCAMNSTRIFHRRLYFSPSNSSTFACRLAELCLSSFALLSTFSYTNDSSAVRVYMLQRKPVAIHFYSSIFLFHFFEVYVKSAGVREFSVSHNNRSILCACI